MKRLVGACAAAAAACLAGIALLVCYQVFARYLAGSPPSWTEELARYLQVWSISLAAPLGLDRGMHLAMDYLSPRLAPPRRAALARLVLVLVGAFSLALAILGGSLLRIAALQTTPALGISMVWPYLAIPVGGGMLALVAADRFRRVGAPGDSP